MQTYATFAMWAQISRNILNIVSLTYVIGKKKTHTQVEQAMKKR